MHTPAPVYTFLVDNIDYQTIYLQPLPNSIDVVIENLNNQAIYVPFVNKPLKNGDVFTLFGKEAKYVYEMFVDKKPRILTLLAETDRIPTLVNNSGFDIKTLPIKSAVSSVYISTVFNYSGRSVDFLINSFLSNDTACNITLTKDGILDENSPSNSFFVSLNNNSIVNFTLNSDTNFYYTYTELNFQ